MGSRTLPTECEHADFQFTGDALALVEKYSALDGIESKTVLARALSIYAFIHDNGGRFQIRRLFRRTVHVDVRDCMYRTINEALVRHEASR